MNIARNIKRACLMAMIALFAQSANAFEMTDTVSVLDADMSGGYRNAVRQSFYNTLDNYAGLEPGYHGFVDVAYTLGLDEANFGRLEFSTTHGYQINSALFVGAGFGLHYSGLFEEVYKYYLPEWGFRGRQLDVPIFADVRWTILNNRITPFIDVKGGGYVTHHGGVYASVMCGCRFYVSGNQALSASLGYSREDFNFEGGLNSDLFNKIVFKNAVNGFTVRIAYEF